MQLQTLAEIDLGSPIGNLRAVPVEPGDPSQAVLLVYSACAEVDPFREMFFYPTDTLKLALCDSAGRVLWRRELGRGVVPGVWFCPVFPFDLDGDGRDEIWFVNNVDDVHPFALNSYRLERLDAGTGQTTGRWPWPAYDTDQCPSHLFRNFILGGMLGEQPVLVTAQGTYGPMFLQARDSGPRIRWEKRIAADEPGARGSHMCPVTDLDGDGRQEIMWGERCIELHDGRERFCADRATYRGHSDVVQPLLDRRTGSWYVFTCREGDPEVSPRVALYDDRGKRVWGDIHEGHVDMGWVARGHPEGRPLAMAIRIGGKAAGPAGFSRQGVEEFAWDALTGERLNLPFSSYGTLPVDLDGDGCHEFVRNAGEDRGEVCDASGAQLATFPGHVALACRFLDRPGEHILAYSAEGSVRILADGKARDSEPALARFSHPLYRANRRLAAAGYNVHVLGGI